MDLRDLGIEVYANDEPDDPNPGVIVDTQDWKGQALTVEQALHLADTIRDVAQHVRLTCTPGKVYDHEPRPGSEPGPGESCKECGEDITWIGPGIYDYLHVDDEQNR